MAWAAGQTLPKFVYNKEIAVCKQEYGEILLTS